MKPEDKATTRGRMSSRTSEQYVSTLSRAYVSYLGVGTDALRPFSDKRGRAWPLTFVTTGLSGFARVALPNVRSALRPGM